MLASAYMEPLLTRSAAMANDSRVFIDCYASPDSPHEGR